VRLANKAALITGAASGIGLGMAQRFAAEGAAVTLVDRDAARGEAAIVDLQKRGLKAQFYQADLGLPDNITRAVGSAVAFSGRLDIVVNNAAVFLPKGIEHVTVGEWDWLMAVNLRAPFLTVQAALPALKASRGNVLNVSSTAALRVFSPNLPYIAAKAALIAMTKSLAQELHPHRIRVNCLCPGAVDTPALHADIEARGHPPTALEQLKSQGYLTTPEEIASVALYLVSEEASALTGSIVVADAGAILA
jgi:NAD(P)-dependent dehydrogenase (short-subunit alcohol dehydrogenase family)